MPAKAKASSSPKKTKDVEPENSPQNSADEMNADEMEAFNKIMGEIEGEESDPKETPSDETSPKQEVSEPEKDDFAAELEKVVQEANAASGAAGKPAEKSAAPKDDDDDAVQDLDADQQKAFENIMAQIEEGKGEPDEPDAKQDPPPEAQESDEDEAKGDEPKEADPKPDEAVDPEKQIEQAVETEAEADEPEKSENAQAGDEPVDAEQQEAFETIMAQIEGQTAKSADAEDEAAGDVADSDESDSGKAAQAVPPKSPEVDESDETEAVEEAADEGKEQEKPRPPESEEQDLTSAESEDTEILIAEKSDNDENAPPKQAASPKKAATAAKPKTPQPGETVSVTKAGKPAAAMDKPVGKGAKPLPEALPPIAPKKKMVVLAALLGAGLLAASTLFWWLGDRSQQPVAPTMAVAPPAEPAPVSSTQAAPPPEPMPATPKGPDSLSEEQSRLAAADEKLKGLRAEILAKQAEIEELRAYYQAGIDAEMASMVALARKMNRPEMDYNAAISEPRIRLGLAAIQRRNVYIRKLVKPASQLFANGEELLYLSRRKALLAMLVDSTSDMDIDGFLDQCETVLTQHADALAHLNIDAVAAAPLSMEAIWNDVAAQLPDRGGNLAPAPAPAADGDNTAIATQICKGDFTRKHQLTVLNPKTARCLAGWTGKDLFLHEIEDLSADTARELATWKGDWLGLNGLKELTPEAATQLARWQGRGLSLNGLERLSSRVVAILSEWQGEQIELINVKHMAHWENPNTRLFLSEEMLRKLKAKRK